MYQKANGKKTIAFRESVEYMKMKIVQTWAEAMIIFLDLTSDLTSVTSCELKAMKT